MNKCVNSDCDEYAAYHINLYDLPRATNEIEGGYCFEHLLDKLCYKFQDLYRRSDQPK